MTKQYINMRNYVLKSSILLLVSTVVHREVKSDSSNVTTIDENRHPRVSGRIIKLYTGIRPEPITCTEEGFRLDPVDCSVFYRCIKVKSDRYSVLRFQCGPGTVYDPENEVCNHPQNTKRSECRSNRPHEFFSAPVQQYNENEIDVSAHELPSPITTQKPNIISQTSDIRPSNDIFYQQDMVTSAYDTPSAINQLHQSDKSQKFTESTLQTDLTTSNTISVSNLQSKTTSTLSSKQYTPAIVHSTSEQSDNQCINDGFMGDSIDCRKFYRCVNNVRGGFTKYEFTCSETTIWDDELQSCNHPWAVRRSTCTYNAPFNHNLQDEHYNKKNKTTDVDSTSYGEQKQKYSDYSPSIVSTSTQSYYGDRINYNKVTNTWPNQNNVYVPNVQYPTSNSEKGTQSPTQYSDLINQTHEIITTAHNYVTKGNDYSALSEIICTESGFIGDPNNCKKFYRCVQDGKGGYTKHEFLCGERTAWDKDVESCNHEWLVTECGGKKLYETSTTEKSNEDIKSTSTSYNALSENNIYHMESHNFKDEKPQFGSKVSKALQQTTETIIKTSELDLSTEICKYSGYFGSKSNCKKFYRCLENAYGGFTKLEYICDEGSAWDSKIESCNHESKLNNCSANSIIESKGSTPATEPAIVTTISLKQTTVQYNPSGYISTDNENSFNVNYQQYSSPNIIQTSRANICQENGFMADQYDCRKFYRCVENENGGFVRFEYTCGDETAWDTKINACNHLRAVETCQYNSFKESTPLQDPPYDNAKNVDNTYTTQGYNNKSLDIVKNTTEGTTENNVANKSTSTTITTNEIICTSNGFIGDSVDCKKFYRCILNSDGNYIKYEFTCGEGTVWDSEIEACNHIGSVKKCGGISSPPFTVPTSQPSLTTQLVNDELDNGYNQGLNETKLPDQSTLQPVTIYPSAIGDSQTCSFVGFYGDTSDCKKFYRCVENGQGGFNRYEFSCGDGTAWDPKSQTCNHISPDNSNCTITPATDSTSKPPMPVVTETASTQHIQENIETNEHSSTEKLDDNLNDSSHECLAEGFYPNKMDCKKFYRCVENGEGNFARYDFACGEGTVWVQDIQACDHDVDNFTCNNKVSTVTESLVISTTLASSMVTSSTSKNTVTTEINKPTVNSETNTSDNSECPSDGFYANSKDCRQFYRCAIDEQGALKKYDYFCGEGTAWDLDTQTCNHISAVKRCTNKEMQTTTLATTREQHTTEINANIKTTNTPNTISSAAMVEDSSSTDNCENEGYFGDDENCQKFYRCVNNGQGGFTKYDYTCAEGTIWDQDIVTCNHPRDVKNPSCNKESKTTTSNAGTESSTQTTSTTSTSPSQLTSKNTNQGTSNCSSTPSSKNETITCTKAGFYPNPNDCKKFYRCVDWDGDGQRFSVFHFECGEGTIWDPALDTCNYEDSVYPPRNCSGSQTQAESSTSTSTSTTQSTTTTQHITSTESTTQQITSTESTTQEQSSSEITTTTQTTSTTVEQQTTPTTEKSTSVQSTTENLPSSETTTTSIEQSTSTEATSASIDLTSTASTEKSTTTMQTTTDQQSTSTTEPTSTESTTTSEQSSTYQSTTTTVQSSTDQTTTSEQSSTEQSTSTTSQSSTDQSTSEPSSTEQTTSTSDQTTTTTEQQSSTQTTASSTEPSTSTDQTTTQSSTTTQQMSTDSSTENQSTSSTTDESTTSSSTTTESNHETTTTGSSSTNKCPDTESDQFLYVCPTSFKRHPKYCNLFYQCLEDNDTHELKIAVFNCPNGTIYDESKIQCVEESKSEKKCVGSIANNRRLKRLNANSREIITASKNTYRCPRTGHFPFENKEECSPALLKCEFSKSGQLRGFVYRCPENYAYWSISRKCEPISKLANCKSSNNQWSKRWEIPIERKNVAK